MAKCTNGHIAKFVWIFRHNMTIQSESPSPGGMRQLGEMKQWWRLQIRVICYLKMLSNTLFYEATKASRQYRFQSGRLPEQLRIVGSKLSNSFKSPTNPVTDFGSAQPSVYALRKSENPTTQPTTRQSFPRQRVVFEPKRELPIDLSLINIRHRL